MSHLAMKLALALLPPSRKAWGEAMRAEYAHLSNGQSDFAWGCLGASLKENATTFEGVARIVLVATAVCFIVAIYADVRMVIYALSSPHFSSLETANYIAECLGTIIIAAIATSFVFKTVSKTIQGKEAIDLGAKLFVLHVVGMVFYALYFEAMGTAQGLARGDPLMLDFFENSGPVILIFGAVAALGWRNPKRLHFAAFAALLIMVGINQYDPMIFFGAQVYTLPEKHTFGPFAELLGAKVKVIGGQTLLNDPPLTTLKMAIIWACSFGFVVLGKWSNSKAAVST